MYTLLSILSDVQFPNLFIESSPLHTLYHDNTKTVTFEQIFNYFYFSYLIYRT